MSFEQQVRERQKEYRADSYSMSYGELLNLYSSGEIIISPDFQRFFRWNLNQKSRFIESLLLDLPTPSIFVYQRPDGKWELVDGLQRLSTLFEFVGVLKDGPTGEIIRAPLMLAATEKLPLLKGVKWNEAGDGSSFPESLKLELKRRKVVVQIIQSQSDVSAKFEVFQRLNTGGSFLSQQEVRNCLMIMLDKELYKFISDLSENIDFKNCISLSERLIQERYDMELVVKYLALHLIPYDQTDVSEYLTSAVRRFSGLNLSANTDERKTFEKVFSLLNKSCGEDAFTKFNGSEFKGKFLESAFEAISSGLRYNVDLYEDSPSDLKILKQKVQEIWSHSNFKTNSGSGSNAASRIPALIEFGKSHFKK